MFNLRITGRTPEELQKNLSAVYDSIHKKEADRQLTFNPSPIIEPATRTASETKQIEKQQFAQPITPLTQIPATVTPAVVAPSVPIPATTPVAASSEFDSRGMPWDGRVHAETKGINKDGSWRSRRGVDKKDVAAVEMTLQRRSTQPAVVAQPVPSAIPSVPTFQAPPVNYPPMPSSFHGQPVAPPVVQQAPPVYDNFSTARKQAHDLASFTATLIPSLAKLVEEGKLTPEYIGSLKNHFGVKEIWELNEQQCAEMFEQFAAHGLINKVGG
jgi:hypothetical protein